MSQFRHETKLTPNHDGSLRLAWISHGTHGSVEFWFDVGPFARAIPNPSGYREVVPFSIAGVEIHSRKPFAYSGSQDIPDNEHCSVLDAPCWHDGSSCAGETCLNDYVKPAAWDALWGYLDEWVTRHDENYLEVPA